ncbi:Threonylcarbamoyladenosine tRNA methylthiotransferase [Hondaea fermentalgiana]|uniref:Threonylcarbamoyladenosine tRNA methylthiotransferase n=1 Tax=Hondaea fermentalgiana TaxID=2315210 RepID=A0A2R5GGG0_9STRA|nr:Threonylcarbamoyladenosine tRNA methylthiotransferase [Hondaea fermentalgiana]|eukprot:GBG29429.1 Threonylcarbamoyladenosine tRNA methylthiotransferase [Hondaea fermentalgiana]
MEDIEDLAGADAGGGERAAGRGGGGVVLARGRARGPKDESPAVAAAARQDGVPGVGSFWSKTFGCSHNVSDGEYMEGALVEYGYRMAETKEEADVWLVNSCTVKDPSQSAFLHVVEQGQKLGKPVVVAGCVPQADRKLKGLEKTSVLGVTQIDRIVEVVEQALKGNTVRLLGKKELPRLDMPKVRKNKLVEIVPLSTGCLGSCTYCKTKHARGKLGSYDPDAIVARVENVLAEEDDEDGLAAREIWLASEDTGAYGRDLGTNLGSLLERLTQAVAARGLPDRMLRLGMTNPPFILAQLDRIAAAMRSGHMFKFLHMPVQSGSNAVLDAMRREYTVEEFERAADYMLKHVPGLTLATDIICGFPTETEDDFDETMELVAKYKFPVLNISQFYPRPGTPAAKMKRLQTQVVKDRSRRISAYFETYMPHEHLVGKTVPCWVSEEVSRDGTQSVGHTDAYVKVVITPRDDALQGKRVFVKVSEASKFHVAASVVSGPASAEEM